MRRPETLSAAWDAEAESWIAWARSPVLDHAFWRMNLPALLDLVPEADGLTVVDVACGEGRVARELRQRGHTVIGVESSPTLARAAVAADPDFEVHVADAAAMPIADGSADLAVASLALMNVDDPAATIAEIARVLRVGGRLCASILHPFNSWGDAGDVSYFATTRYSERLEGEGRQLTVHDVHRPLSDYFVALADSGFAVDRLVEPIPDDAHVAAHPDAARWRARPAFMHLRAELVSRRPSRPRPSRR